ncbi:MAG: hypothetical protein HY287_14745 [Planctomycetes bacterium]|nr:hypothetical protein [Planctomycetota bacterium]MBI3835582.1 hypothetical protein [Planctomycetota bacterium]
MKRTYVDAAALTIVGCVASLTLTACANHRPSGTHVKEVEHEAVVTVENIDVPNRLVTVRDASGNPLTVYVDESVKTFPQAKVGDQVRVRYLESLAVRLMKPSESTTALQVKDETTRMSPGQPIGKATTEVNTTVRIESVDRTGSVVTFTGPRGRRTVHVVDPSLRDYVRQLRAGDNVDVTYKEALAISLERVSSHN